MLEQLRESTAALHEQSLSNKKNNRSADNSINSGYGLNRLESQKSTHQRLAEKILSEIKRRRALGESYSALAADLNNRGLRGPHGARWYTSSVRALLYPK